MMAVPLGTTETHRESNMNWRIVLGVSARAVLGLSLLGITHGTLARAAEIKLLCASALHPALIALIPDFEKSSGHKITVAYGLRALSRTAFRKVRLRILS
jgi:molybdate transport system substrate-binding protein